MSAPKKTPSANYGMATTVALVIIAIIVVVNVIVSRPAVGNFFRVDLTEDKLYTLSQGTQNILGRLEDDLPVTLRYYVSDDDRVMPQILTNYGRRVEDLLNEFGKAGKGKLIIEKLITNPNTDEEDKATTDQIQGIPANNEGDKFYMGIAVECLSQKEVMPFLNPSEEIKLEYSIARAVQKVITTKKPVIGIMSPLPMMGSGNQNPMMMMQQQQQQQPAWVLVQQLKNDYDVREVQMTAEKIDSDITVLMLVHPASLEDRALYAVDQFVLRGGKLIAFVDPKSVVAEHFGQQAMQQNRMMGGGPGMISPTSDMKKLFDAWGIGYDSAMTVADMSYRTAMQSREVPTALTLTEKAFDKSDRLTADLNSMFMLNAGSFTIGKADGVEAKVLAQSSEISSPITTADADKAQREQLTNFSAGGRKLPLVVRLTGKFKTAFPEGEPAKPAAPAGGPPREGGGAQDEAKPADTAPSAPPAGIAAPPSIAAPAAPVPSAPPGVPGLNDIKPVAPSSPAPTIGKDHLKESKNTEGVVLLFADADMIYDGLCLQRDPFGGMAESNGNLSLVLGAVEILSGGGDLIAVRNRASPQRPFETLQQKRAAIEERNRPEMAKLQAELQDSTEKLANLRGKVDKKTQRIILDPQSQADMAKFQDAQLKIQKQIAGIKREQRTEMEWEENKIRWLNISLMPLGIIAIGLALAMNRRAATAAK